MRLLFWLGVKKCQSALDSRGGGATARECVTACLLSEWPARYPWDGREVFGDQVATGVLES